MAADQRIQFFSTSERVRIAYSVIGAGPPIVRTPPWLSHLDLEWQFPAIREFYQSMARERTVVRYDSHGCGLSDWERDDFSLASEVRLLEEVADNLGIERFALFGYAAGGAVAIAYAERHPERVSNLILFGTLGGARRATFVRDVPESYQALITSHWELASRLTATLQAPEADGISLQALASLYQQSSTGENALKALRGLVYEADVSDLLPRLQMPTAVIHRIRDPVFPYQCARQLAARIPSVSFTALEGSSHLPYLGDSASVLSAIADTLNDRPGSTVRVSVQTEPRHPAASDSRTATFHQAIFRREGEYWTVAYRGDPFRIKDARGMAYIAQLLRYPDREFHARELEIRMEQKESAGSGSGQVPAANEEEIVDAGLHLPGDLGEMLDAPAKRAYRRRLEELRNDLEQAKASGNAERASELEGEISFLTRELSRAVGLGGRDRRAGSLAERSRINVTRAIHRSIGKIAEHNAALGELLATRIRTGLLCLYRGDERSKIDWEL
ncbi:MAG: alpha/beta fold hydrolase [Candidatus Binataceae bacterium]